MLERNRADDTFGWGVVFSDQTMGNFRAADRRTFEQITGQLRALGRHRRPRARPHDHVGRARIQRHRPQDAAADPAGRAATSWACELTFRLEVRDPATRALGLADADLIVAADGVNSASRARHAEHSAPTSTCARARYIWLGTHSPFDAFTFYFVENEHGVFQAHCLPLRPADTRRSSSNATRRSWRAAGFDRLDQRRDDRGLRGAVRARGSDGHRLHGERAPPARLAVDQLRRACRNRRGTTQLVLIGDAAHTAHFSIGSGTKLAMEDAIALARVLGRPALPTSPTALRAYQDERSTEALRLQNAARNSMEWFENVRRYIHLRARTVRLFSLLTRSQRVSHENLRLRDREYLDGVERGSRGRAGVQRAPTQPRRRCSRRSAARA